MDFTSFNEKIDEYGSLGEAVEHLEHNEEYDLKNIISKWTHELNPAHEVLEFYLNIVISDDDMRRILMDDLNSAYEVFCGSIGDTGVRRFFMMNVLEYYGLEEEPCKDTSEHKNWKKTLDKAVKDKKFKFVENT